MTCSPDQLLTATYTSFDAAICDAENVLLYNVGSAAFAHAMPSGVRFERLQALPPVSRSGKTYAHHHDYRFIRATDLDYARPSPAFEFPLERISSATKPHQVWWAASGAKPSIAEPIIGPFELLVELPASAVRGNLAGAVKPLVDGIISALHSESQIDCGAVQRLATITGWDASKISNRLRSPSNGILGSRRLLSSYRGFVKWNPADDRCQRCTVIIRSDSSLECIVSVRSREAFPPA
jgi:hypothetical protein